LISEESLAILEEEQKTSNVEQKQLIFKRPIDKCKLRRINLLA